MAEELRFDGQVAIVTGAGRGIGRAHAHELAARGAAVVVNDLGGGVDGTGASTSPAQGVVEEITAAGGAAVANGADVATGEGAASIVATALDRFGRVDIVVNNAGILTTSDFAETDLAEMTRHLSVHLLGAFNVTQAAWPHFVEQRYGRIVSTTSASIFGMSTIVAYASAKAGLVGLTRSLAAIGEEHGIKANLVAPLADTRMTGRSRREGEPAKARAKSEQNRTPELISPLVAFLCHASCPVSGEIYSAGMGGIARIFMAETVGYTNQHLTAEDVRDNWAAIGDETGYFAPSDFSAYSANFRANRTRQAPQPGHR